MISLPTLLAMSGPEIARIAFYALGAIVFFGYAAMLGFMQIQNMRTGNLLAEWEAHDNRKS